MPTSSDYRHVLLREIGRGGGGVVHVAEDRIARSLVAIKSLLPDAPPAASARLAREHALLVRCRHPHLVRELGLVDASEIDASALPPAERPVGPSLVLEMLEGPSLATATLPKEVALQAWVQVAHAVEALHAHGFVHRDLKPQNVLLRRAATPDGVDAVLADLGASVGMDEDAVAAGTLDFAAPETLAGAPPRPAADVYGLGGLLFALLTGRAPWTGMPAGESFGVRRQRAPEPPASADIGDALTRVLATLLAPRPESRPATALGAVALLNRETGSAYPELLGQLAPRPGLAPWIGRLAVLDRIEAILDDVLRIESQAGAPCLVLVRGEPGSGRTRLLEEVQTRARWRGLPTFRQVPSEIPPRAVLLLDEGSAQPTLPGSGAGAVWFVVPDADMGTAAAGAIEIRLGALDERECLDLAAALVGLPRPVDGDGAVLRVASAGLPGPLETIVAALAPTGGLRMEGGRLRVDAGAAVGVDRHLQQRLESLSAGASLLLELSSVIGRPASGELIAAFAGLPAIGGAFGDGLGELVETGFLRVADESGAGTTYEVPDMAREAVLAGVRPVRRRLLHLGAAALLGRCVPGSQGERAEHLDEAGAPGRAAPLHAAAGQAFLDRQLPVDAARHLEKALVSAAAQDRPRLLVLLGRARALSGDPASAIEIIADAAPRLADDAERAEALAFAAKAASHAGDPRRAEEACRGARRLFRRLGSHAGRAECTNRLGMLAAARGDLRRARPAYRAALAVARREGARELEARVLNNLGMLARSEGDLDEASLFHAAARDIRRRLGDAHGAAKATNNLGIVHGMLGRQEEAASAFAEAAAAFQECGDRREEARCLNNRGMVLWQCDRLSDAEDAFSRASTAFASLDDRVLHRSARRNLALVQLDRGRIDEALHCLRDLAAEEPAVHGDLLMDLGDAQRSAGELAAAEATHGRAATALAGTGRSREGVLAGLAADLDAALGGHERPVPAAPNDLEEWPLEMGLRWRIEAGRLAEVLGDPASARDFGCAALDLATGSIHRTERVEALLLAGGPAPQGAQLTALQDAVGRMRGGVRLDLSWRARARLALGLAAAGRTLAAATQAELALEDLQQLALGVAEPSRDLFLSTGERRGALQALAQVAAAPDRRRHAQAAPALLDFVRLLNANLEVDRLLPRVVDFAVELAGADRGSLMLFDEGPELVRVARSSQGLDLPRDRFQHSRSIVDRVRATGEPMVIDAFADESLPRSESIHELRLGSATCVPLPAPAGVSGGLLGALYVDSLSRQSGFGPAEVEMLRALAVHASTAIVNAQLLARIRAEKDSLRGEIERLRGGSPEEAFGEALGRSAAMRDVFALLERVAPSEVSVLIEGESGTGKEVIARSLHARSRRSGGPFVAVDCGGLPESLVESELFGHRRGAFTGADRDRPGLFEQASGGTIFLDEIAGTTPSLQAKLLRALQEREIRRIGENVSRPIDVRVLAASNRYLAAEVAAGRFREDLFYRLNVVSVRLPPLRERPEDIALLARHFLRRAAARESRDLQGWQRAALQMLTRHPWPGNVRELGNVVERAAVMATGPTVTVDDLPPAIAGRSARAGNDPPPAVPGSDAPPSHPADLWSAVVDRGEDFWRVVRDAYVRHEVVRDDVRSLVSQGLLRTGGSYRAMARLFRLGDAEYKRFMDFLRQNDCRVDFRPYRAARRSESQ